MSVVGFYYYFLKLSDLVVIVWVIVVVSEVLGFLVVLCG